MSEVECKYKAKIPAHYKALWTAIFGEDAQVPEDCQPNYKGLIRSVLDDANARASARGVQVLYVSSWLTIAYCVYRPEAASRNVICVSTVWRSPNDTYNKKLARYLALRAMLNGKYALIHVPTIAHPTSHAYVQHLRGMFAYAADSFDIGVEQSDESEPFLHDGP